MNKKIRLKELIDRLEKLAPRALQASWDNAGLIAGLESDEISKVLVSLDVTPKVVDYAVEKKADLLLTHHPYLRSPVKKINDPLLIRLIRNKIALYSMHTNLDFAESGVNAELASVIGLNNTSFLTNFPEIICYHIAVYTPEDALNTVSEAMFNAGAGIIGRYSHCMNSSPVEGFFKPLEGSDPYIGKGEEQVVKVDEIRLELTADSTCLERVVEAMIAAHPYETPAYRVFPLKQSSPNFGPGMVGDLPESISLKELALHVKERLEAPFVLLWLAGKKDSHKVKKIAICGGSGGDLIPFAAAKAELFLSADFKYHNIITSPIPLIDGGHFFTENVVLPKLGSYISSLVEEVEIFDKASADIQELICL